MLVVADTNVIVSGFLWNGNERRLLDAARDGIIELFTSPTLLEELEDVLSRPKFTDRLASSSVNVRFLVDGFAELANVVETNPLNAQISRDEDDDALLACAVAASCEFIVTGDDDLLVLNEYNGIRIMKTAEFLAEINL